MALSTLVSFSGRVQRSGFVAAAASARCRNEKNICAVAKDLSKYENTEELVWKDPAAKKRSSAASVARPSSLTCAAA